MSAEYCRKSEPAATPGSYNTNRPARCADHWPAKPRPRGPADSAQSDSHSASAPMRQPGSLGFWFALIGYMKLTATAASAREAKIAQTSQATSAAPLDQQVHDIQRRARPPASPCRPSDISRPNITAKPRPTPSARASRIQGFPGEALRCSGQRT